MNNYPQAENPLILYFRGQPPALKNNKVPIYGKDGKLEKLIPNKKVETFLAMNQAVKRQVQKQGFDKIPFPLPVMVYAEVYLMTQAEHKIPSADGDNAYTMLQETLADPEQNRDTGSFLSVIDNDRQVLSATWDIKVVPSEQLEGAIVYLWLMDPEQGTFEQRLKFGVWYHTTQIKKAKEDITIDFAEMEHLFDNL